MKEWQQAWLILWATDELRTAAWQTVIFMFKADFLCPPGASSGLFISAFLLAERF